MIDGKEMFRELWNFVIGTIETIGVIWDWLLTNHYIGFSFNILGADIGFGFNVLPIGVVGAAMAALLIFAFIKDFVPVA